MTDPGTPTPQQIVWAIRFNERLKSIGVDWGEFSFQDVEDYFEGHEEEPEDAADEALAEWCSYGD